MGRVYESRSLNRRRMLRATATGSAALAGSLAACRGAGKPQSIAGSSSVGGAIATRQPKKGGAIRYGGTSYDTQGRTFDPNIQTQFSSKGYTLFYERLLAYNPRTYKVEPELGQRWEQPSPTEYLFTLQPGVKWQDKPPVNGRPLTVDDVRFSLERARTNDPRFYSYSILAGVDKIEASSAATVRISTKAPDASTLIKLSVEQIAILSREVLEKNPKPATADSAVGTGAFMMKSVEERVAAEYIRNPTYWKPGLPYLDGFRTRYFADPQSAWAAFSAGQVDVAGVPGSEIKGYLARSAQGQAADWFPADDGALAYPNNKAKPLDDPRVTRALRLLIDHQEFKTAWAEAWSGRGRLSSLFPPALIDWDLSEDDYAKRLPWKQPKDDAAKEALSLLAAAGYNKATPLKFALLTSSTTQVVLAGAQLLQAQWKRLSQGAVDVDLKPDVQNVIDTARANRSFQYAFLGHSAGMVDADIWLSSTYHTGGSLNFGDFSDATLDGMIEKQRAQFDEQQRKSTVRDIIFYAADHVPSVLPAGQYSLNGVASRVQGYSPERSLNGRQFQSIWLDS